MSLILRDNPCRIGTRLFGMNESTTRISDATIHSTNRVRRTALTRKRVMITKPSCRCHIARAAGRHPRWLRPEGLHSFPSASSGLRLAWGACAVGWKSRSSAPAARFFLFWFPADRAPFLRAVHSLHNQAHDSLQAQSKF